MSQISNKLKFFLQLAKTNAFLSRRFSSQGLGFGDIAVLYYINRSPTGKIRRVDLAEAVGLTSSGVTRLLLPLEKIGVIQREINERDARVSYASLTQAGKTLLTQSLESAEVICDDLISADAAKKLEDFSAVLAGIKN
ncbi:MAG TPA: MarR family transcriptional regulator [Candidatus Limnocylindria bacterium]|nr:MarR family transcriptional regulator [Candidatus Limnocylindria bacterium]